MTLNPDPGNLPGGAVLQQLTDGLGGWALIMALVGLVIGAAAWALGAHSQNYHQSFNGRKTVLVSALAALSDRGRPGHRQLLLPRRAGGALTVLEAFALCPGSLPVVGTACSTVSGAVGGAAGAGLSAGVGAVFSEASRWVASGAVWLIAQVGRAMSATTSIDLDTAWFGAHEAVMATLAAAVVLPMACCAAIQAVYRQSASMLLRTFFVHLPLSLLLTGVAVTLVRMALAITDAMSARSCRAPGSTPPTCCRGCSPSWFRHAWRAARRLPASSSSSAAFVVASAALVLWLELVVRAAAVSVAVLFLPLALAALVWPSVAHWCRRLADTLVALVLSKLVIAAVLSLAAGALAGGLGSCANGGGSGGGFAAVVTGIALLVVAILSPFTLLRLVPAVEAGAAGHLEVDAPSAEERGGVPARNGTGTSPSSRCGKMTSDGAADAGVLASVGSEGGRRQCRRGCRRDGGDRRHRGCSRSGGGGRKSAGAGSAAVGGAGAAGAAGSGAVGGLGSSPTSVASMVTGFDVGPECGIRQSRRRGLRPLRRSPRRSLRRAPASRRGRPGAASSGDDVPGRHRGRRRWVSPRAPATGSDRSSAAASWRGGAADRSLPWRWRWSWVSASCAPPARRRG